MAKFKVIISNPEDGTCKVVELEESRREKKSEVRRNNPNNK